jgi:23S rRNA (guanine745-N1)-methyltransferase
MSYFCCPVCGADLTDRGKSLGCENLHSFDRAKSGYVNLLLSQQRKDKRHGDDKRMVAARRDFLNKGYYRPLLTGVSDAVKKYAQSDFTILDAGCGECYFTAGVCRELQGAGVRCEILAVDISKEALHAGAARCRDLKLAVASVFRLPVKDASCEIFLSLFAPCCGPEFFRVLKQGGILIRAVPLEKHLWSLKKAVYDAPYENKPEDPGLAGFELIEKREIKATIRIAGSEDILNAFSMTPYFYKTGADDQKKLLELSKLDTETEFGILIYRRQVL